MASGPGSENSKYVSSSIMCKISGCDDILQCVFVSEPR